MPVNKNRLARVLAKMKKEYEGAKLAGTAEHTRRSHQFINILRDFAIEELKQRIGREDWFFPDKKVTGFPKAKKQDILIEPPQGGESTGPILSVNVRAQLSSIQKNYETMFERVTAEALNLHNRFPYMVLGYLYLVPMIGYDYGSKKILLNEYYNLEKYVASFSSISGRSDPSGPPWKYERVCLLIVDFSLSPPKVISDLRYLVKNKRVSPGFARIFELTPITIEDFFDDLYRVSVERNPFLLME